MEKTQLLDLLKDAPPSIRYFMAQAHDQLTEWGVEFQIYDAPAVYTVDQETQQGIPCSGFFEDRPKVRLGLAIGKPWQEWVSIFAHEYAHAQQWHEQSPVWTNLFDDWGRGIEEASNALDGWLSGDLDWDTITLWDVINRARNVELDCERRTLGLIDQYNLPIDREDYAQKAAAYVYFYNHLAKTRQWNEPGQAPYQVEEVYSKAPKELTDDPFTPPELEAAFDAFYGDGKTLRKKAKP